MEPNKYKIYTGVWTNWERGRILGSTLTLEDRNALFLVSFLTAYSAFIGAQIWRIVRFALHQIYYTSQPTDAIHQQRQIILRNVATPDSAALMFAQMLREWSKAGGRRRISRLLPPLIISLTLASVLMVASVFVGQVFLDRIVLLDGEACGTLNTLNTNETLKRKVLYPQFAKWAQVDAAFAQQCYGSTKDQLAPTAPVNCGSFVKTNDMSPTVQRNQPCPFRGGICKAESVEVDTGYLDSHRHLGINAPEADRFTFRQTLTCAPLKTLSGRYTQYNNETASMRYMYGLAKGSGSNTNMTNQTYEASIDAHAYQRSLGRLGPADYSVDLLRAIWYNKTFSARQSTFTPIPELVVPDATVYIIFLSANGVVFLQPESDPWFEAKEFHGTVKLSNGTVKVWRQPASSPASPLACAQRFQYCFKGNCTALVGQADVRNAILQNWNHDCKNDALVGQMLWFDNLSQLATDLGMTIDTPDSLLARLSVKMGEQAPLDTDHWVSEVRYWVAVMLASLQRSLVDTAAGPRTPELVSFSQAPRANETAQWAMCRGQKLVSADHQSFSFFGVLLLLIMGIVIIGLGAGLPALVDWVTLWKARGWRWRDVSEKGPLKRSARILQWRVDSSLQLHRLAHEELGLEWKGGAEVVPVTKGGFDIGMLDVSNPNHPRLWAPRERKMPLLGGGEVASVSTPDSQETLLARESGGSR